MSGSPLIPWVIVGGGRLGSALSWLARDLGVEVRAVWSRSQKPDAYGKELVVGSIDEIRDFIGGCIVWITVSDDAIADVAAELVEDLKPADIVIHASGSQSSAILKAAGVRGPVGSIHPLLSVGEPRSAARAFSECAWTVEGDYAAIKFAHWLLGEIGVDPFVIQPEKKAIYHASAVASAGLLTALMDVAFELAREAGFDEFEARDLLLPLATSTLANLREMDPGEALTGPVARGDDATIERHLASMQTLSDSTREVYEVLTRRSRQLVE